MEEMEAEAKKSNNNLLLLGLELLKNLNKSNKLPYAVVRPRVQAVDKEVEEALKEPQFPMSGNDRKRKHSDEISVVEKKEKRRMMNRIAAQNARDRKKNHMDAIEKKLALLEEQNKLLAVENQKLKERTSTLEAEKKSLVSKLQSSEQPPQEQLNTISLDGLSGGMWECPGSAVSTVSLQKEHTPALALQTYLTVSLISWIYSMKTWGINPQMSAQEMLTSFTRFQTLQQQGPLFTRFQTLQQQTPQSIPPSLLLSRMESWWGAHNPGWNPPLN